MSIVKIRLWLAASSSSPSSAAVSKNAGPYAGTERVRIQFPPAGSPVRTGLPLFIPAAKGRRQLLGSARSACRCSHRNQVRDDRHRGTRRLLQAASRPYQLALCELNVEPQDCLFVGGSAYDLYGADAVGLRVFWHDRIGMTIPPGAPPPLVRHDRLTPLQALTRRACRGDRASIDTAAACAARSRPSVAS